MIFTDRSPLSEAARGVVTTLHRLGIDPKARDLPALRRWFAGWKVEDYISRCLDLAGVRSVCMTNSPFDDVERPVWDRGFQRDPRFGAALRIDPLLVAWPEASRHPALSPYINSGDLNENAFHGARRFLVDWARRIGAVRHGLVASGVPLPGSRSHRHADLEGGAAVTAGKPGSRLP